MPSDEELRRVAEDIRALARSLARDLHEASRAAHGNTRSATRSATESFKQGVREATREASSELKRELKAEFGRRASRSRAARHGWWVPPPTPETGSARSGLAVDPTVAGGSPPPAGPSWSPPTHRHHHRPPEHRPRPLVPPVRRRWDAPVVASAIVVTLGVAWLLSAVGLFTVSAEAVMAAALMLLGAAIVVSARTDWSLSRHAWPVFAGLALIVGLFATSSSYGVGGALTHLRIGQQTLYVHPGAGNYYAGVGLTKIDASSASPGDVIDVRGLFGKIEIKPPQGQTFTFSGRVLAGQICANGQVSNGVGAAIGPPTPSSGGTPPVVIDVHELAGQITVDGASCQKGN